MADSAQVMSGSNGTVANVATDQLHSGMPSLLDPRATGGIHAGEGLTVQERYIALQIATMLADARFSRFQPERNEDMDVWFAGETVRDHHQVKDEILTKGAVKKLVRDFRQRNAEFIERGVIRDYVLACPHLSEEVRGFAKKLRIHRKRYFGPRDGGEHDASLATLRERANKLDLLDEFDFIIDHVVFEEHLVGVARQDGHARDVLTARLAGHLDIANVAEAQHVADAFLALLHRDRVRDWSASQLRDAFRLEREKFRIGPPRPAGDVIMICHQTLKRAPERPEAADLPALFAGRRVRSVEINSTKEMNPATPSWIAKAASELAAPAGPFCAALANHNAQILYYGFPHVPFAVLAGFIARSERVVALVEHDLESGRFQWRPDAPVTGITGSVRPSATEGDVARLRISISARVREEQCDAALVADRVRIDLHLEADKVGRGTVATEAQARAHVREIRRVLDEHIAGNGEVRALHVFAAVPVSVAFALGQMLAHSSLPRARIHNFNSSDVPPYRWSLDLQAAVAGEPCVHMTTEKG